jgi:hypothetical protein
MRTCLGLGWLQQDLAVWAPDFVGSILFLGSGYLAFGETCYTYWAWKPQSLSWWITFTNLVGCVAFMISAFFAFVAKGAFPCQRRADFRLHYAPGRLGGLPSGNSSRCGNGTLDCSRRISAC